MENQKDIFDIIQTELDVFQIHVSFYRKRNPKINILDRSAFRILEKICEKGPLSISNLSDAFHLDISTISRQIAGLDAKGYIRRIENLNDKRVDMLEITQSGKIQFNKVKQAFHDLNYKVLSDWPDDDLHKFAQYLERMNQAMANLRLKSDSDL